MEIIKKDVENGVVLSINGRLDTVTAPELADVLLSIKTKLIILDFKGLEYISSAGLRVLLSTHKKQNAEKGKLIIKNPNDMIQSIFALTGFIDILNIETDE